LSTRPIYHSSDAAIRGHVCSFLALVLRKHLQDRCAAGFQPEWLDVILDLNRLQEARLTQNGKAYVVRTEADGVVPRRPSASPCRLASPPPAPPYRLSRKHRRPARKRRQP
jgi:hypothetical protein